MTSPEPRTAAEDEVRVATANDIYVRVVIPDTIWWDDLPPEMQEGWLRAADYVQSRIEAEAAQPADTLNVKALEVMQHAYDLLMLLAFAKPDAEQGVPQVFAVLDEMRPYLAAAKEPTRTEDWPDPTDWTKM